MPTNFTRRMFLRDSILGASVVAASDLTAQADPEEPIIDIHQHTHYHGRSDEQMIAHQRAMGITQTILLPSGSVRNRPSTWNGRSNGLAAKTLGNESVMKIAKDHPGEFVFGANEVTDIKTARKEIEKYLKLGAKIIGEQKFNIEVDSEESQDLYRLAAEYKVPILLHFQFKTYNKGFERFWKMLEKHPKTIFIGHAQTWWANIDKDHSDQKNLYPKTKVTAGGITDRYLREYPNMFGDMSAGSGLNALIRDEDHTREFLDRNQDKLLYGSDCADSLGRGPGCQGSRTIAAIRRLAKNKTIERKLLFGNSKKLFRL